ncbi:MAG TPA: universal stress protein [Lacipirellulaceae bacterium]|jgi:nucleotide-binding universal stress UspA family protein|nr:universal stress protein [Lacipirellulaceae bacterium]
MKVLVGVDGSANSFAAVEFVGRLLSPERDQLVLLFATPAISFEDDRLDPAVEARARAALGATVLEAAGERLPAEWRRRAVKREIAGSASARLLEAADAEHADLLALGQRGTSGIVESMLGGVSRAIAHSAKIAVLIVKNEPASDEPTKQSPGPAERHMHVLMAVGESPSPEKMASLLKRFTWPPETRGWAMKVVRRQFVCDLPNWIKVERNADVAAMASAWEAEHQQNVVECRTELEVFRTMLPQCFIDEELVVSEGRPAEEILAQSRKKAIDLIVLGSQTAGTLKRLLLGSTSEQVLRNAPCSVLIVR